MSNCNDSFVPNKLAMRYIGGLCIVLSIIEFGIGGWIYGFFSNLKPGGWWGVVLVFVCGIIGVCTTNRCLVITGCTLSVIGLIICVISTIVDGAFSSVFNQFTTCSYSSDYDSLTASFTTFTYYGDMSYPNGLNIQTCLKDSNQFISENNCACISNANSGGAFSCKGPLYLSNPNNENCGMILGTYAAHLRASTAFLVLSCLALFAYSVLTCNSLCCQPVPLNQPNVATASYSTSSAPPPTYVVQTQPNQQQWVVQGTAPQHAQVVYAQNPYASHPGGQQPQVVIVQAVPANDSLPSKV